MHEDVSARGDFVCHQTAYDTEMGLRPERAHRQCPGASEHYRATDPALQTSQTSQTAEAPTMPSTNPAKKKKTAPKIAKKTATKAVVPAWTPWEEQRGEAHNASWRGMTISVHHHIYHEPETWLVTCYAVGLSVEVLKATDVEDAKREAVERVCKKARETLDLAEALRGALYFPKGA